MKNYMDKKVYYGEYSLKHWIELLLKKDLELPPYQRNFVWSEEQVKEFVNGLAGIPVSGTVTDPSDRCFSP